MAYGEETKREVVILGVKGSGKTVFLSVLGHAFEKIGEFGLNLRPDPKTKRFVFETWNLMAPDDGSPQEFPPATDPNSDPLPLTWNVQLGTSPVFRLSSLDCAGETMVRAFTEGGDAAREQMFSDALDRVFAAMDRGVPAPDAPGAMAEADPVTRLRTMTRRASVVCLFLNPRDFESQIAALPRRFRERLERRVAELRASNPPDLQARLADERERSRLAEDRARKGLRDRHLAMLELLSTFLENPEFGRKRIVFVLTQTGEPDLREALRERGGPWAFLRENVRELEAYDLAGRADALAVSSVDVVAVERNAAGDEIPRPDGPITSSGLLDFLLVAGGACSQELAGLDRARAACRLAEAASAEAILNGLPHEERFQAAQAWNDRAAEWRREAAAFLGAQTGLSPAVRRRTLEFADADVRRAARRFAAEGEIRRILFEGVAAGDVPPAPPAGEVLARANAVVEAGGGAPFDEAGLGLGAAWWEEACRDRAAAFSELQARFDAQLADLDWEAAAGTLGQMRLPSGGAEQARREAAVASARRDRAVRDGREALGRGDRPAAERALADLGEAERDAGPSEDRAELEEGLAKLVVRQDALQVLESARGAFEGMDGSSASMRKTAADVRSLLAKGLEPLAAAEGTFGAESFADVRAGFEGAAAQAARLDGAVSARRRNRVLAVLSLLALLAAGWAAARLSRREEMESIRDEAVSLSRRADFQGARRRLNEMPDWPFLLLRREDFAPESLTRRWSECEELGVAKSAADAARLRLAGDEARLTARFGGDAARLDAMSQGGWSRYRAAVEDAEDALPRIAFDVYGLPPEGEPIGPAVAAYRRAEAQFRAAAAAFAPATSLIEASASSFRLAREETARRTSAFEGRLRALETEGARRSIPVDALRGSTEWRACAAAFARATNALPRAGTDRFGLPDSAESPSDLARRHRAAMAGEMPAAEQALAALEASLSLEFARRDAAAAFREVEDRFPAAVDLANWAAAAQAVSGSRLDAVLDASDVEAAWTNLLRAAGPSAARPPSREGWAQAGRLLGRLIGDEKSASAEEKAFAGARRPVCDAAARVYAEADRRRSFAASAAAASESVVAGDWAGAAEFAIEAGKTARLADERKKSEGILKEIRDGALADIRRRFAEGTLTQESLAAAGIGSPTLRKEAGEAFSALLEGRWPEKAPDGPVSAADWDRFRRDMELLSSAESAGAAAAGRREDFEARVRAWNGQWVREAAASAALAAAESRPERAWTNCEHATALLRNVRQNPWGPPADLKKVAEVEAAMPCLLRVSAEKNGVPIDVKSVSAGKAVRVRDGVVSPATGKKTSILSYGKTGYVPCDIVAEGAPPKKGVYLNFRNRGTDEQPEQF